MLYSQHQTCCRCSLLITKVCASRRLHASFLQPARSPACLKGFCANMSHPYGGALVTYNSLMDKHLTGYFNNTRIRRHLRKAGLITRSGRIISEREYRLNAMRRDHQRYVRECLAQAIFHKVLDMERHHQIEIKRKLETFARKEQVHRSKVDQLKRTDEEIFPLFSPCPPAGPRSSHGRPTLADDERSESSESSSSSRPNTAPGTLQRPVRLQPLQRTAVVGTLPKSSPGIHQKSATLEPDHRFPCGVNKDILKLMSTMDHSTGPSPYQLPIINNYVAPVPPPPKRSAKNPRHATRGRRIRPTTAPNELDQLSSKDLGKFHKISVHSNVAITMVYLGKSVHLSHDDTDYRDEIKALQQHCGGENLCVYKGKLLEGETFQFTSRRHRGFPFSLTLYLNGLQVDRVSSCCEYRHRRGARLGGKHGHFGLVSVEGASPCYRCIIAMGLDKKPTPPPKKQKDDEDRQVECPMDDEPGEKEGTSREGSVSAASSSSSSSYGEDREMTEEKSEGDGEVMKDKMEEEQDNEENPKDEYDEDFEVYEEKPDDNERGQADDQKNGNSKSTSDDEKDDLDHEKESKNLSQRQHETSDVSEKDEDDRYSDSESEREDRQDRNKRSSISSSNTLYSSSSGDESEAEKPEDHTEGSSSKATEENQPELYNDAETEQINSEESADEDVQRQETDVVEEEESEVTKEEAMSTEDDGPMKDFQDGTSKGLCNVRLMETGTADEGEENVLIPAEEDRTETEYEIEGIRMQEPFEVDDGGDCKLVQEKIAKAIGSAEHLNSEPEPSDSSTDDDDNVTNSVHDVDERKVVSEEKEWIAKELIVSKVEEKFEAEPKKDGSLKELRKEDKDIKDEATEQVAAEKSASLGEEEAQEASPGGEKMSDPEATTMPMDVDVKILKGGSPERVENSSNGTVMAKEMTTNGKELVDRANGLTEEANHESGKIDEGSETTLMGDETNERDGQSGLEEAEALVGTKQEDVLEAAAFVQEEVIEESAPKGEGKKTIKNEEASGEVSSEGKEAIVETTYELEDLAKDIAITMKEVPAEANQGIKIRSDKASHELEEAETKMVDEVRTDKVRTELELMRDEAAHEWEEMGTGTEPNGHRMTEEIVVDNKTPKVVEVDGNKIFVSNQETAMEDAPQLVEVAALKRDKTIEESVTEEEDTTTEAGKCTALEQEEEVVSVKETAKKMVEVEIENVKEEAVITEKVISNTAVPKGENMAEEAEFEQEKLTEELAELTKEELAKETEHECEKATMEVAPMKQEEAEEVAPEEQEEETPVKWEEAAPGEQEEATPLKWEEAEEAPAVKKEEAEEAAPEEQEEETPVKCEEAAPGEQEEEAPVKCEEAAPGEQEEATPLKWEEAEEAPAVKKEEAIELAPVTSEEVEEIANKGELMIEKAAPEREGEGIMEDSSIIRDEMTEEIFEREEVVSHSDEVEKAPIETEKATEETKCETEEAGKEVVPEREEVSEEKISKQEEAAEKVDPEREVVSEERISKQEEVAEKVVPEREVVSEERISKQEEVAEKVVPKREEEESVITEEALTEKKLKEGAVAEEGENVSAKERMPEKQNATEVLMLEGEEASEKPVDDGETMGKRAVHPGDEAFEGIALNVEKEVKAVPEDEEDLTKQVKPENKESPKEVAFKEEAVEEAAPKVEEAAKEVTPKGEFTAVDAAFMEDEVPEERTPKGDVTAEDTETKGEGMFEESESERKVPTEEAMQKGQEVVGEMMPEREQAEEQWPDQPEQGGSERKEELIERAAPAGKVSAEKEVLDEGQHEEHLCREDTAPNFKESVTDASEIGMKNVSKREEEQTDKVKLEDGSGSEETSIEESLSSSENRGGAETISVLKMDLPGTKKEGRDISQENNHETEVITDEQSKEFN